MSDEQSQFPELKLPPKLEKLLTPPPTHSIDWARAKLGTEVGFIRDYLESMASAFDTAFEAFDSKVAEEAAKLPEDMRHDLYEDESMTAFNLKEHFPAFSWQTTFVSIYSFLEDEMLALAAMLGRHIGIKLSPDDLRHNGIFAAKVYLTDLCGIAFPDGKHPWQEILHYNPIRNVIVHSRGRIWRSKKAKAIRKYAEGKQSITTENDRVQLSKEFCLEVLGNVRSLLGELMDLARAKIVDTRSIDKSPRSTPAQQMARQSLDERAASSAALCWIRTPVFCPRTETSDVGAPMP
jgi:hypothetical protein